jgi:hypothetical protein
VIRRIADYRADDKYDPDYYARRTVTKAQLQLAADRQEPIRIDACGTNELSGTNGTIALNERPSGKTSMNQAQIEVIDSTELAKRLHVPETWVRSRTNLKRTDDPIPHLRLGRYVRFYWGSEPLEDWLARQLVSTNRAGH